MTNSTTTESAIEVAGRRLNPGVSPEWQYLLTHFDLSEGFSFVMLLVPDGDWAEACRIALARYLEAEGKILQTVAFEDAEDFRTTLPGRLLELHLSDQTGAVWVSATVSEASPQYEEWKEAWRGMAARLNQFRNPLSRQINVPLLFVGAHWIQPVVREIAPDLWSVRTMVTRVESHTQISFADFPTAGPSSEQQLEGMAIDPDLAVQAGDRLRGQPGKELALAQLLYRAGLGLNARSRWRHAEVLLREAVDLQRKFDAPASALADSLRALAYGLEWQCKNEEAVFCLDEARSLFASKGEVLGETHCIKSLGDIAFQRSEYETARSRFEEALRLYRQLSEVLGEANCIQGLGNIALAHSDHETARARFEEALNLYPQVGSVLGAANCIQGLGDIAYLRSDHETALARFEEALRLYRQVSGVLGEANCIMSLGDLALARSDRLTAAVRYEEALPLFRQVGSHLGEANCIMSLGDLALARSDHLTAAARYKEALPLFRQAGSVLGEANCIQGLGDLATERGFPDEARSLFEESLILYQRVAEPYSIGRSHVRLARLARGRIEREKHLLAAREAWKSIDRPDLIRVLKEEFDDTEDHDATDS